MLTQALVQEAQSVLQTPRAFPDPGLDKVA